MQARTLSVKRCARAALSLLNDKTVTLKQSNELIVLSGVRRPASRKHPYTRFRGMRLKTSITSFWCMIRYGSRARMWCMGIWCWQDIPMGTDRAAVGRSRSSDALYKKFKSGWYALPRKAGETEHSSRMLISRGFGTSHIPRACNVPQNTM